MEVSRNDETQKLGDDQAFLHVHKKCLLALRQRNCSRYLLGQRLLCVDQGFLIRAMTFW